MAANIMKWIDRWVPSFDPGYEECRVCKVQRRKDLPFDPPRLTIESVPLHREGCDLFVVDAKTVTK